ncbi:MAG: hypothetical protein KJO07_18890, partial [Deltaproteobacteria bacterium]|nr:hypothetical protein [Deltaproteobacteria bacterium]
IVHHYLLDFGMSLGVNGLALKTRGDGYERFLSLQTVLSRALTFGLWGWHFERFVEPGLPHVGVLEREGYRPDDYRTRVHYMPWKSRDRFDTFWAAKRLARVEREHIEGAVAAARYPDRRSAEYVIEGLVARRQIALRHYFGKVAPIDEIAVEGSSLCFVDLGVRHRVLAAATYSATARDYDGRRLGRSFALSASGERYCAQAIPTGSKERRYTIVRIRGRRAKSRLPPIDIHLAEGPAGMRVIGVRRH